MRISDWSSDVCSSDLTTGEIYIEAGDELSAENLEKLDQAGIDSIELLDIDHVNIGPWIRNTLKADKAEERDQALSDIYRVMRPGEPPTRETAEALFAGLFFDPERYDLSAVKSEEHTSELQSLMRSSYAVFCLKQ